MLLRRTGGLLLALSFAACSHEGDMQSGPRTLVFSAIPDQDGTRLAEKFEPIAAYLNRKLRVPVRYQHASSYQDAVDHFRNGDVQLAWFGGLTGVQARHAVAGARAIAQGEEDPTFFSYFIANASTGLERSESFPMALEGHSFTFGSRSSTSGRLMPEYFILEHTGRTPREFFGAEPSFSGSHDKTAELVESGAFDAGVINYKVYEQRVREGKTNPEVCRIIWKTPVYSDYNFTAHPDLEKMFGEGFTDKLQRALIQMKAPDLLSAFPRKSLIAAKNEDFDALSKLASRLGFVQ